MQLHNRFAFDEDGFPMLYVFDCCRDFIRTIPSLVYDSCFVEDIDTGGEDHIYDETRYMCMFRPILQPVKQNCPASAGQFLRDEPPAAAPWLVSGG